MAPEAQIRANIRKSRGSKTDEGEARSRLNALKHGLRTEVAAPVAPQEDPAELEARIQAWVNDYQPAGVVERDLIERAAKLSWALDRAERHDAVLTAQRVRAAMLGNQAERAAEVCGLARKLLYMCGKRASPGSGPAWDDDPAVFAAALERSPEGTRWLIERWTEIRLLIDSGAAWTFADQFRFIRLLGKHPVDAVDDPELNAIILAWEAIEEDWGVSFWSKTRDATPSDDPAFNAWRQWRALAPPPEDRAAGWSLIRSIVDRELKRLARRRAILEEAEGTGPLELAERALLATDNGAERLRRHRSTLTRELLRTLDAVAKLRKAGAPPKPSKKAPSEANPAREDPDAPSLVASLHEAGPGVGLQATAPDPRLPATTRRPRAPRTRFPAATTAGNGRDTAALTHFPAAPGGCRNPPGSRCPWPVPRDGPRPGSE